jgi:multicomponent Na+:H+ antiporter subunit C
MNFLDNYLEIVAMILFAIGFTMLLFSRNLLKKIIGLNIMDTGIYLFLAALGYISGKRAPIVSPDEAVNMKDFINPIPSGLVLTGIVVSVSVTAIMLSLCILLYEKYHTLNLDEIYMLDKSERHHGKEDDEE